MKNYQLQFHMASNDYTQKFETKAVKSKQKLSFNEPNGDKHIVTIYDDEILYQKQGSRTMKYVFKKGEVTKGYYEMSQIPFEFDIRTTLLRIEPNKVQVNFELYQNNIKINTMVLHIRYDALKEEYNAKE